MLLFLLLKPRTSSPIRIRDKRLRDGAEEGQLRVGVGSSQGVEGGPVLQLDGQELLEVAGLQPAAHRGGLERTLSRSCRQVDRQKSEIRQRDIDIYVDMKCMWLT